MVIADSKPTENTRFLYLTKIHKPTPVGRPIISGNDGPTEQMSAFVDSLLQPIAKSQQSYLKDTTDFINFIEMTELPEETFLVNRAAMGRARFLLYMGFIIFFSFFFLSVTRPKPPLGQIMIGTKSRNL